MEELSFGFQSLGEAIEMWLKDHKTASYNDTAVIDYKERKTLVSIGGILAAYQNGYLSNEFEDWLEKQIKPILKVWAEEETNNFIYEKLPLLLENDYE